MKSREEIEQTFQDLLKDLKDLSPEEFDEIMSEPYSKEGWVVMPEKPLPEKEEIANFLKVAKKSIIENPSIPYCASCWKEMEIEPDHMTCPLCGRMVCFREEE